MQMTPLFLVLLLSYALWRQLCRFTWIINPPTLLPWNEDLPVDKYNLPEKRLLQRVKGMCMMFHLFSRPQTFVERSKPFVRGFLFSVHAYFNLVCPRHGSLYRKFWSDLVIRFFIRVFYVLPWTNGKCLATKRHQALFGDQTFYRLDTLFGAVCRVW